MYVYSVYIYIYPSIHAHTHIYIYTNKNKLLYIYAYLHIEYIYIYISIYRFKKCIYMAVSQNCVWNVPRCSGRMERRGFVTVLVPDLWSVMKYKLYIHMYIYIYIYIYTPIVNMCAIYISGICLLKLLTLAAAHFHFSSAHICTTCLLYTCSTQVCLAWLVLVH